MMADYDFLLADDLEEVSTSCDCPTAPRQFLIPPPPPPPAMGVCGGAPLGDPVGGRSGGYFCHLEPMGAEFTQAGFPSLPVIAVCSSVVLVAVLVACFLLWRHKTKVQNLLPSKHDPNQADGHCGVTGTNGITYEDALINHHPTRLTLGPGGPQIVGGHKLIPIELLDVKLGDMVPQESVLHPGSFYPCREATRIPKPFNHPVYEEIARDHPNKSNKSYDSDMEGSARNGGRSFTSEDEFAEDELSGLEYPSGECSSRHCSATSSVQGSTGGDLCKDPVSSDEGTTDDCDYSNQAIPGLLPQEHSFDYSGRKQMNLTRLLPSGVGNVNPVVPKTFQPASITNECQKPFRIPPRGGIMPQSTPQWCPPQNPVCNVVPREPSIENIYSTIDEGDLVDSNQPVTTPGPAAIAASRNLQSSQSNLLASKRSTPRKADNHKLSQRNDEDTESYGDIMPAYDAAACAT